MICCGLPRSYGFTRLDHLRAGIFERRAIIARLAGEGIEVRPYVGCSCDGEVAMDRAVHNLRILKRLYAEALTFLCSRPGPRLPREFA